MARPPPAGTIAPAESGSVSRASVMCDPRDGRMRGTSASSCSSSGRSRSAHTPVALTTLSARTCKRSPLSASRTQTPRVRPPSSSRSVTSMRLAHTAPKRSASASTVSTRRLSSVWQS